MGNLKLALFLAYKSIIKGSRWTLVLIVLVMSLSFANLILTPSIMSGVTAALDQQQIDTLFGNVIIDPPDSQHYLNNINQIENQLSAVPAISGIAPRLNNKAFFEYHWQPGHLTPEKGPGGEWNIIGIYPDQESQVTTVHEALIAGSYLSPDDRDSIVLGVEIAGGSEADNQPFLTLGGAEVGDKVRLTYPNNVQREYTVKGIFKARAGGANSLAFITASEMESVLRLNGDTASQILLRTQPSSHEDQILSRLQSLGVDGQIRSWRDYGGSVSGVVSSFGVIASLIGGIGLVVAGIVMFIVIYINVINRQRQIGILRAIGINRDVVMASYLLQALLYAALGIIFGGLIFGYIIKPYFDAHPIDLPIGLVSVVIDTTTIRNAVFGLLIAAILAGVLPVLNITRHSIIKAIWGD